MPAALGKQLAACIKQKPERQQGEAVCPPQKEAAYPSLAAITPTMEVDSNYRPVGTNWDTPVEVTCGASS